MKMQKTAPIYVRTMPLFMVYTIALASTGKARIPPQVTAIYYPQLISGLKWRNPGLNRWGYSIGVAGIPSRQIHYRFETVTACHHCIRPCSCVYPGRNVICRYDDDDFPHRT
jgi:hypothetical protein